MCSGTILCKHLFWVQSHCCSVQTKVGEIALYKTSLQHLDSANFGDYVKKSSFHVAFYSVQHESKSMLPKALPLIIFCLRLNRFTFMWIFSALANLMIKGI